MYRRADDEDGLCVWVLGGGLCQGVLVPWRDALNSSRVEALEAAVLEGRDTPSSGLISTFLLLQLCDSVTVYGFAGINDGNRCALTFNHLSPSCRLFCAMFVFYSHIFPNNCSFPLARTKHWAYVEQIQCTIGKASVAVYVDNMPTHL